MYVTDYLNFNIIYFALYTKKWMINNFSFRETIIKFEELINRTGRIAQFK